MTPLELGLGDFELTYWSLASATLEASPQDQADVHQEDLVQLVLPTGDILDVGWYPANDPTGSFSVFVVRNGDWDDPVEHRTASSWEELATVISICTGTSSVL